MEIRNLTRDTELSSPDLGRVSGGMKYDHDYVSPNVIDARGGSFDLMGLTYTFDVNGHISSIS